MASTVLFKRKSCSTSASTLKATCTTVGDNAFHTEELPAMCVNTGLQNNNNNHNHIQNL